MKIFINDSEICFSGETLNDLLFENGFSVRPDIAVAVNETVISRNSWSSCTLSEGDSVLIITPSQGG